MATRATVSDLLRMRLHTQRLSTLAPTVAETVRHLLAVQAQDFAQSLWAVGVRSRNADRTHVLAALEDGSVVRSLPMRGTLHFVPADDLRWMLAVTSERMMKATATRFAALGLDEKTFDRAAELAIDGLSGGRRLGRAEFIAHLEAGGISCEGQRGYHLIFALSQRGLVCWGPPSGTQQALVLVDEWIAPQQPVDRAEAIRRFAVRYFAGHGPATERDFAWWTKLTLADARAGIAAAASELERVDVGDDVFWVARSESETAPTSGAPSGVYALPGFDEYLLGYQDRSLVLAAEHSELIVPGSNGIFLPTIVAKGRIVGTWRRTPKSKVAEIVPEHFGDASPAAHAAFAREAARYARFTLG